MQRETKEWTVYLLGEVGLTKHGTVGSEGEMSMCPLPRKWHGVTSVAQACGLWDLISYAR